MGRAVKNQLTELASAWKTSHRFQKRLPPPSQRSISLVKTAGDVILFLWDSVQRGSGWRCRLDNRDGLIFTVQLHKHKEVLEDVDVLLPKLPLNNKKATGRSRENVSSWILLIKTYYEAQQYYGPLVVPDSSNDTSCVFCAATASATAATAATAKCSQVLTISAASAAAVGSDGRDLFTCQSCLTLWHKACVVEGRIIFHVSQSRSCWDSTNYRFSCPVCIVINTST